jgi:translation elongation factor EF-Tu-like GTPase
MNPESNPILFTTADVSTYPERFNQFLLDEPVDVELVKGQYSYSVYESLVPPVTIEDTTEIVIEEGRMVVSGAIVNSIYD